MKRDIRAEDTVTKKAPSGTLLDVFENVSTQRDHHRGLITMIAHFIGVSLTQIIKTVVTVTVESAAGSLLQINVYSV